MRGVRIGVWTLCVLLGCASQPTGLEGPPPMIFSQLDPAADLSTYRTYAYLQPLDTDERDGTRSRLSALLIDAVDRELGTRGLRGAGDPGLLVNFELQTALKQGTALPAPAPRYRRVRYRQRRVSATQPLEYTEGTLRIDLIDAHSKTVVWEGVAQGPMQGDPNDATPGRVRDLVGRIFEQFPDAVEP